MGESHEEESVWIVTEGGPTTSNLVEKSLGEFQKQLSYSTALLECKGAMDTLLNVKSSMVVEK